MPRPEPTPHRRQTRARQFAAEDVVRRDQRDRARIDFDRRYEVDDGEFGKQLLVRLSVMRKSI